MCHQTVSLVQAQLELSGIATASLSTIPEITRKMRPPRALVVPYRLGFALGEAGDHELQRAILTALLLLCLQVAVPVLENFQPGRSG